MDRQVPRNIEAEQGVLGSILIDPEAIVQVADFLTPGHFYREAHHSIYAAMLALYENREVTDFITLCDALERREKLEDVGGAAYITSLINGIPTSANIEYYGHIVERTSLYRRLIHAAGQIAALAYEQEPNALDTAQSLLYNLENKTTQAGFVRLDAVMEDYQQELDELQLHRGALIGVSTGYRLLDQLTSGLQKTDLIILAGRPGSGKTALATNIAYNAALTDKHVAVFSLEMGNRQLARRLLSMESGVELSRLRTGWIEDNEWEAVARATGKLSDLPIWLNDAPGSPILTMRSQLRRLIQEQGVDLMLVDYLQLIDPGHADGSQHHENRVQAISEISMGLKRIAKEFNIPVLALAQLSRAVEQREKKIPRLSDLRESGSIENDADMVLMIYRDDYYAELEQRESLRPNIADVYIAKYRNGPTGMIPLYFKSERTKFYPLEEEGE